MRRLDRAIQRWRINQALPWIAAGDRVLDIGCADGALFRAAPHIAEGVGIDPILPADEQTPRRHLVRGAFPRDLPPGRPYDVITLLAVLEHVPTDRQGDLAASCARHLRPGGRLVVTVPSIRVDALLFVLRALRLVDGMSLEQHYGFDPRATPRVFEPAGFRLIRERRFELGLNHLFVFERTPQPVLGAGRPI